MTRPILWMTALALALACSNMMAPEDAFVGGVITSRAAKRYGVQDETGVRTDSVPAMFVEGAGTWPRRDGCAAQAYLLIGGETEVFRRVGGELVRADTGQLVVGRRVTVWIDGGLVLSSCPPEAAAIRVLLEEGS
jgi:hypothetical protein